MKYIHLLLFAAMAGMCSCTTYYARVVTMETKTPAIDNKTLSFENDTLSIKYNFYGDGPYIGFTIYNKIEKPLYIDWGSSLYITGNTKHEYSNNLYYGPGWRSTYGVPYEIIPPRTSVTKVEYLAPPINFVNIPMKQDINEPVKNKNVKGKNDSFKAKATYYDYVNSPYIFRSYLSISVDSKTGKELHFDHEFWVSNIKEMKKDQMLGVEIDQYTGAENNTYPYQNVHNFYMIFDPTAQY